MARKFSTAGVPVAQMTPPDANLKLYVNANRVRKVDESDPNIYHKNAKSVLVFSGKIKLAVREEVKRGDKPLLKACGQKLSLKFA